MNNTELSQHGLLRSLRQWETLALSFGAMIGWSWVVLIAPLMQRSGSAGALIATAVAGTVIILIGAIYAELCAAMPEVGGEHAYSLRAMGRNASFVCTWAIVFAYVSVVAFEAVALPTVMTHLFPFLGNGALWQVGDSDVFLDQALIGSVTSLVLMWINIRGVHFSATLQAIVVLVILLAGFSLFAGLAASGTPANMTPLYNNGLKGVLAAMALVPFMLVGFDVIPQAAEEIDLAPRKIGILLVASIAIAVVWYLLIELAVGMLLTLEQRSTVELATVSAAEAAWGRTGATLLLVGGVAGILTSWNGFLVGGSRALFALGNHHMVPAWFGQLHRTRHTPVNALLFIGILGALAPLLGRQALIWFVDGGGFGLMIAYILVCASFIMLRRNEPAMTRPFMLPGGMATGLFGLLASIVMATLYLPGMPAALVWPQEWLLVLGWFLLGIALFRSSS
ncbi:MAG: APC family permease [Gammaproteobacteria bacterium]|nr:APC family permease [Gammaproteobacteria bacterium]NNF60002.1 APC family permease [Gammaproteobacteria bacterium]NNM20094.1 APC family permease [Gammaproteobacteria bacterium]